MAQYKYLGIDLGTTYTQAALLTKTNDIFTTLKDEKTKMLYWEDPPEIRTALFPSQVFIEKSSDISKPSLWKAGWEAEEELNAHPRQVLRQSKTYLSSSRVFPMPITFEDGKNEHVLARSVSSVILDRALTLLISSPANKLDLSSVEACTITYPASFPDYALQQTKQAAYESPSLRSFFDRGKIYFIPEPIAAILAFLKESNPPSFNPNEDILVVDVGGGTTDLTVVRVKGISDGIPEMSIIEVGDHILQGGEKMDTLIARDICNQLWSDLHDDHFSDNVWISKNRVALSDLRRFLDRQACIEIKENFEAISDGELLDLECGIDYVILEDVKKMLLELGFNDRFVYKINKPHIDEIIQNALNNSAGMTLGASIGRISERFHESIGNVFEPSYILFAGGGSRLPQIESVVRDRFSLCDYKTLKTSNCQNLIAKGAAIYPSLNDEQKNNIKIPTHDDYYLKVYQGGNKNRPYWFKIMPRSAQNSERYEFYTDWNTTTIELTIGKGFYSKQQGIDRVKQIFSDRIDLGYVINAKQPIVIYKEVTIENAYLVLEVPNTPISPKHISIGVIK